MTLIWFNTHTPNMVDAYLPASPCCWLQGRGVALWVGPSLTSRTSRSPPYTSLSTGGNCIKIGLPGKSILGDYVQENGTSRRPFLLLRISFPGRPIFIQFIPALSYVFSDLRRSPSASWRSSSCRRMRTVRDSGMVRTDRESGTTTLGICEVL